MTNPYILNLKAERAKAKKEYTELKIKCTRLFVELQNYCNPFEDVEYIKAEAIEQAGDELLSIKNKAVNLKEKINRINSELGEN